MWVKPTPLRWVRLLEVLSEALPAFRLASIVRRVMSRNSVHRYSRQRMIVAFPLLAFGMAASGASLGGWDLTKPLSFYFPPPIAVEPTSSEPSDLFLKNGGPTFEDQIMELVNQERWDNGQLPPLKRNSLLDNSAETHSSSMATRNFFAHCDPDTGTLPWDRITVAGYSWNYAGENLAGGSSTAAGAMAQWMGSPLHRDQILSTTSRELGVGYVHDPSDTNNVRYDGNSDCVTDQFNRGPWYHYWTQNFGLRNNVYPVVIEREAYETATRNVNLYLYGSGWANEMRIRNENGSWTLWQSFSTNVAWQLSYGASTKEVYVEIRQGATVHSASDTIHSTDTYNPDQIFTDGVETGDTTCWSSVMP